MSSIWWEGWIACVATDVEDEELSPDGKAPAPGSLSNIDLLGKMKIMCWVCPKLL